MAATAAAVTGWVLLRLLKEGAPDTHVGRGGRGDSTFPAGTVPAEAGGRGGAGDLGDAGRAGGPAGG